MIGRPTSLLSAGALSALSIILLGLLPGAGVPAQDQGWSGTITEKMEFGLTSFRGRKHSRLYGPVGGPTSEATSWETSWDLDGDRTLEITIADGNAQAGSRGQADWSLDENGYTRRDACIATLLSMEHLLVELNQRSAVWLPAFHAAAGAVSKQDASLAVLIAGTGEYSIQSGGKETVYVHYYTQTTDQGYFGDATCSSPSQPGFYSDSRDFEWARNWSVALSGRTCDPNHLQGSSLSDWHPFSSDDARLLDWFTESKQRAGILDPYEGERLPLVRVERKWDLRRGSSAASQKGCRWAGRITSSWGQTFSGLDFHGTLTADVTWDVDPSASSAGATVYTPTDGQVTWEFSGTLGGDVRCNLSGGGTYSVLDGDFSSPDALSRSAYLRIRTQATGEPSYDGQGRRRAGTTNAGTMTCPGAGAAPYAIAEASVWFMPGRSQGDLRVSTDGHIRGSNSTKDDSGTMTHSWTWDFAQVP